MHVKRNRQARECSSAPRRKQEQPFHIKMCLFRLYSNKTFPFGKSKHKVSNSFAPCVPGRRRACFYTSHFCRAAAAVCLSHYQLVKRFYKHTIEAEWFQLEYLLLFNSEKSPSIAICTGNLEN